LRRYSLRKEVKIMIIERSLRGLNSGEFSDRINELGCGGGEKRFGNIRF